MSTPVSESVTDPIWIKNFFILFKPNRLIEFFPNKDQTLEERLNSVVRLGIYTSILLILYKRNWNYSFIIGIVLLVSYTIYNNQGKETKSVDDIQALIEKPKKAIKVKPTQQNPFMNLRPDDFTNNPHKEEAPEYHQDTREAHDIKEDIDNKFIHNLYQDFDDAYSSNNSRRNFVTMPVTTLVSDQEKYLDFVYGGYKDNCKSTKEACIPTANLKSYPQLML